MDFSHSITQSELFERDTTANLWDLGSEARKATASEVLQADTLILQDGGMSKFKEQRIFPEKSDWATTGLEAGSDGESANQKDFSLPRERDWARPGIATLSKA